MNTTIRGHNLRMTMVMALLAVLLLAAVIFAVWQTATTSNRGGDPANYARSADGAGGSSLTRDPYTEHAKVVARLGDGTLR
jgi:hypothetical protein